MSRPGGDNVTPAAAADSERLARLLGGEALAELRARLRERYARGLQNATFTLIGLTAEARQALEGLLGRTPRAAGSMRVSQAELDAALARAGLAADLRAALEILDGPIADRKAARLARDRAWAEAFGAVSHSALETLVATTTGRGLVKRLAGSDALAAGQLLHDATAVLSRLPARGIPLARLATETTGDAHALDAGRALATLVLGALAPRLDALDDPDNTRARNRWAALGITVNELAAPALILNLAAAGSSHGARLVNTAREAGEPVHLALRTLLRTPPTWDLAGRTIYVCENPTVVAVAADALGQRAAPLVCTDGMPSASQRTLLRQLGEAGAVLRYHGDYDWPGLHIGNWMMRHLNARPWRYNAVDYEAQVTGAHRVLQGAPVAAQWDADLAPAMVRHGRVLEEESVLDLLVADLGEPAHA